MGIFGNIRENIRKGFDLDSEKSGAKPKTFDVKKMTNAKFIEFMHETYEDLNELDPETDSEVLEQRYDAFKSKEKVISGLDRIYSKHLSGVTEIDETERKGMIDAYVKEQIKNDPEAITALVEKIAKFEKSEKDLDSNARKMKKYERAGGVEGLEEKLSVLQKAEKGYKVIQRYFQENPQDAMRKVRDEYGIKKEKIGDELAKIAKMAGEAKSLVEAFEQIKEATGEVRNEILYELELVSQLAERGRTALFEKAQDILDDTDDKSFEEIKKAYEQHKKVLNEDEKGHFVLEQEDEHLDQQGEHLEGFGELMRQKLSEEMALVIEHSDLGKLEKDLGPYLKGDIKLESDDVDEKSLVMQELQNVVDDEANGIDDDKRFLLKALLIKYQS